MCKITLEPQCEFTSIQTVVANDLNQLISGIVGNIIAGAGRAKSCCTKEAVLTEAASCTRKVAKPFFQEELSGERLRFLAKILPLPPQESLLLRHMSPITTVFLLFPAALTLK